MQRKRMWITLTVGMVYVVAAMFVMLYAVSSRSGQRLSEGTQNTGKSTGGTLNTLTVSEGQESTDSVSTEQEKTGSVFKEQEMADSEFDVQKPETAYERGVVIDPYADGKDRITADIAERIGQKLETVYGLKVYYTEKMSIEERQQFISETNADFYIGIALNESADSSVYGVETVYNGTYFIPFFGNTDLADCLERNVTEQVSGRANGLTQATEEDIILQRIKIPAVILKAGYLSNEKEAALLGTEEYRDRIAEGVLLAVQEAYEKMENESE